MWFDLEKLRLWDAGEIPFFKEEYGQEIPSLTPVLSSTERKGARPAVVILPGGGYAGRSVELEGFLTAKRFTALGFHTFVVHYRYSPYLAPVPQIDAQRAVKWVRFHAAEYGVDPNKIVILGYSAGGHLAGCTMVMEDFESPVKDEIDRISSRPDRGILCYPVINMEDESYAHIPSAINLLGKDAAREERKKWCLERLVSERTPGCFLWHTMLDQTVPVRNSLEFSLALAKHHVKHELHIFEQGDHGLNIAENFSTAKNWTDLCGQWLWEELT